MNGSQARIRAGLYGYAAGDATGVPWEGYPPDGIDLAAIDEVPARRGWPPGATSDDTALTLLVADYLADRGAVVDEADFLTRLAAAVPGIRGIGPSTSRAVDRFVEAGVLQAESGATNGAAMRALPFGYAVPVDRARRRRQLVVRLSRTTHGGFGAIGAACVAAAMASQAVASQAVAAADVPAVLDAAAVEVEWLRRAGVHADFQPVLDALVGRWRRDEDGVSLDAVQTMAAVVSVVRELDPDRLDVAEALKSAIALGGDTDTVAALVGGVTGALYGRTPDIPWSTRLALPAAGRLDAAAGALSALRTALAQ
jgi:ADP-ribosylglycohydrolase